MSTKLALPNAEPVPSDGFSNIRLIRGDNGYVYSPWWTFNHKSADMPVYDYASRYHQICRAAVAAFASATGIQQSEVVVTQLNDPSQLDYLWRLSTHKPIFPPKPKKKPDPTAIDI